MDRKTLSLDPARVPERFKERPADNEPKQELRYFPVHFSNNGLETLDRLSAKINSGSREKTLRLAICALGKKFDMEIPNEPIAEKARIDPNEKAAKRYARLHTVGLLVPPDGTRNSWLTRLAEASGNQTIKPMMAAALREFEQTLS